MELDSLVFLASVLFTLQVADWLHHEQLIPTVRDIGTADTVFDRD
jgi:hypothetical protein